VFHREKCAPALPVEVRGTHAPGVDEIRVEGLEVRCVVGVYPRERIEPQRLIVGLSLWLDTRRAAEHESLSKTVHYGDMARNVAFVLTSARFGMLETAALGLARLLLAPPARGERRARIERARVELSKPEALHHRATPKLIIEREASEYRYVVEERPFGTVDVIHETRDAGVYRLNVKPGGVIPLHVHRVMEEAELVLSEGLLCQGKPVAVGTMHRWPKDAAHLYENPTDRWQSILCVDSPPFIESDEIVVEGRPDDVPAEPRFMP